MDFDGLGEALAGIFIAVVVILVLGIVGGTVCGIVSLSTHEDVCDVTETVEIVEIKVMDEGYAYCLRGGCLEKDTWFRISSDSFYLDTCESETLDLNFVHTRDAFGDNYRYTLIFGERRVAVNTISI